MAFSEVIPLNTVLSNHLGIYQISLTNWGNEGVASQDANSILSPIFAFPLGGIAIDPDSTVERTVLRPRRNGVVSPSNDILASDIAVDKDSPLTARLSFPRINGFDGGWAIVAASLERWNDEFRRLDGSLGAFGGAVALPATFIRPRLNLILSLDAGKPDIHIPRRFPFRDIKDFSTFTGAGTVDSIRFYPISGRKRVRIVARQIGAAPGAPITLHIRGITPRQSIAVGVPAPTDMVEFELVPPIVVPFPPGDNASVLVDNPLCHYLHLLAEAPGADASLRILVQARDD
jgi:hypothetical protein